MHQAFPTDLGTGGRIAQCEVLIHDQPSLVCSVPEDLQDAFNVHVAASELGEAAQVSECGQRAALR